MPHPRAIETELLRLKEHGLLREPDGGAVRASAVAAAAALGTPFVDASSNDYLGLGQGVGWQVRMSSGGVAPAPLSPLVASPPVSRETPEPARFMAAHAGAGASRLVHGTSAAHSDLEAAVAAWVGMESALLFTSGFAANLGLLGAVLSEGDVVLSDALNHASIIDGCRLSRAQVVKVGHLDLAGLESAMLAHSASAAQWFVTESYFSMDGDGPDLAALSTLCRRHGVGLIVDEAHALGVFGPEGAGRCAEAGVRPDALVGTFGKAVGTQGAFVGCSFKLRSWLWNRARSFLFSTATSPILAQISLFHVKRLQEMDAERAHLARLGVLVREVLQSAGLNVEGSFGPIVPVLLGSNARALRAAEALSARGILTQAIRSPTVPRGTERLRVTLNSNLSIEGAERLAKELAQVCRES